MHTAIRSFIVALTLLVAVVAARAEGILNYVPPSALGFVAVHDLNGADAKIQKVMTIFGELSETKPPAPLAFVKAITGLGGGINESGDALLVALPGEISPLEPKLLFMVTISDYAAFAKSVGGDASGEISRVTIAGQEVLATKAGTYALLMNLEHRPTLETLIAAKPEPPVATAALDPWLATNQFALVILSHGIEQLSGELKGVMDRQEAKLKEQYSGSEMAEDLAEEMQSVEVTRKLLSFLDAEISSAAIGMAVDDATNVKLTKRVILKPSGGLASADTIAKVDGPLLAGYPDQPFVFAGGGPLPHGWGESIAKLFRSLIEQAPEIYGFEAFDASKWEEVEESWRNVLQVESCSMVMFAGAKDEALGNLYGTTQMPNSAKYIDGARKSFEIWNELTDASTIDVKLKYEIAEVDVAGKPALKMTNDVLAAAGDDNVPMMKPMFEKMLGNDGKLVMFWTPTDEHTVVMAISSDVQAKAAVDWATSSESGLANNANVQKTTALMNPAAPWELYISPQGYIAWVSRLYTMLLGTIGGPAMTLPEFPAGPPVGLSVNITEGQLQGEVVFPVQTMKDMAVYMKALNHAD
jgi:hypothetical protein